MRTRSACALLLTILFFSRSARAQEQPIRVIGGHQLGEPAQQFFAEGREKETLDACSTGDLRVLRKPDRRQAKKYCAEMADARQRAMSGIRDEYKSGDIHDRREDTFTFDGGHLVMVQIVFSAPSAEYNYVGHTFEQILSGLKQTYGVPNRESSAPAQDAFGVPYVAHGDLWMPPNAAILVTEKPGRDGSTTLVALTRAEYDRVFPADTPKIANPLQ